jgi:hypothetical protein
MIDRKKTSRLTVRGKQLVVGLVVVFASLIASSLYVATTNAQSSCGGGGLIGTWNGEAFYSRCGYFTEKSQKLNSSVSAYVLTGGLHIATGSQATEKQSFINIVESNYETGNAQNSLGGKFIIQTMRQIHSGAPASAAPDLTDFENRVNNSNVVISVVSNPTSNCLGSPAPPGNALGQYRALNSGGFDDAFVQNGTISTANCNTIEFKVGGALVYEARELCGNVYGGLNGLPAAPPHYNLTPTVSSNTAAVESGSSDPIVVSPTVTNGGNEASIATQWILSEFTVVPGGNYQAVAGTSAYVLGSTASITAYYNSGAPPFTLKTLASGQNVAFPVNTTNLAASDFPVPDIPVGSKVCFALSVQPSSDTNTAWANSAPICVVIGKKPKVDIIGGDVIAGRSFSGTASLKSKIDTSTTIKDVGTTPTTYGSWVEYAAFATGPITGLGSGSAFAGGLQNSSGVCNYSALSFTNAGSSATCLDNATSGGSIGSYSSTQSIPSIQAIFPVPSDSAHNLGVNPTINLATVSSGTFTASGTVTFVGATVPEGVSFILDAPLATVNIQGNINYYPGTLNSLGDIPQVVIIANAIIVDDSATSGIVTNVDAWLIGLTSVNTCDLPGNASALLTISTCSDPLQVNGPVMTQYLYLNRTAGSGIGPASDDPAETFDMRPDTYLWAYDQSIKTGRLESVYLSELPPRF